MLSLECIQIFAASHFAFLEPALARRRSWWRGRSVVGYLLMRDQEQSVLVKLSLLVT